MYFITGSTGNTGKPIALALLEAGKNVRVISRDAEKAKELTDKGAELFVGDTTNAELLKRAFNGVTAVYAMIPMNFQAEDFTASQVQHAEAIAAALEFCKVPYVVSLSSQGAHLESGSGLVLGIHKMEKLFNGIEALNTLHLRAGYFMENTLSMVGLVKQAGIMGSPIKSDVPLSAIATKDIAEYASKRLLALNFEGNNVQGLLGARDVTYAEIAKTYGASVGKTNLEYVDSSYENFKKMLMEQMGASESVADKFNEMFASLNEGKLMESANRDPESTTPTSIEDFSQTFSHVYNL